MPGIELTVTMVVNLCPGGFRLSDAAADRLAVGKGWTLVRASPGDPSRVVDGTGRRIEDLVPRDDPRLVGVVREMGAAADGPGADLRVVRVPIEIDVEASDGFEEICVTGGAFVPEPKR